jgi:uncharacterized protein
MEWFRFGNPLSIPSRPGLSSLFREMRVISYNDGFPPELRAFRETMLLDLNKLRGAREHFERTFQPTLFDPQDDDYRVVAPVELSMDVLKMGPDAYQVSGRATTRLEQVCSRCAEAFEVPFSESFDLRYLPQAAIQSEGEHEIKDDDLTAAFYTEGTLDVVDLLREQFMLAVPMKPLCSDACRGLCPECGANLNRTECGCAPRWEDPRLAPLKGLLNREKES